MKSKLAPLLIILSLLGSYSHASQLITCTAICFNKDSNDNSMFTPLVSLGYTREQAINKLINTCQKPGNLLTGLWTSHKESSFFNNKLMPRFAAPLNESIEKLQDQLIKNINCDSLDVGS